MSGLSQRGASMVEYMVVVACVALTSVVAFRAFASDVDKGSEGQGDRIRSLAGNPAPANAAAVGQAKVSDAKSRAGGGVKCTQMGCSGAEAAGLGSQPAPATPGVGAPTGDGKPSGDAPSTPASAPVTGAAPASAGGGKASADAPAAKGKTGPNGGKSNGGNAKKTGDRPEIVEFDLSKGWNSPEAMGSINDVWKDLLKINSKGVTPSVPGTVANGEGGGWGEWNRTDFYAIEVTMPPGVTPEAFLLKMQNDPSGATGKDPRFDAEVTWPASTAKARPKGDVVDLVVRPNKAAPIMYVRTVDGKPGGPKSFGVVTATKNADGWLGAAGWMPSNWHPVSGYRFWGVTPVKGSPDRFVVWTAGRDAPTVSGSGVGGGTTAQDWTWSAMMRGVAHGVRKDGGTASSTFQSTVVAQPYGVDAKSLRGPEKLELRDSRMNPTQQTTKSVLETSEAAARWTNETIESGTRTVIESIDGFGRMIPLPF
jgi:hypothetical protein